MVVATLCYVKKKGRTLMIHRTKKRNDIHRGKWNGLGGKAEQGETPEECVVREVMEESGLIISNPVLKGILTFPLFDGEQDWYVFVFVARTFDGTLQESSEGHLEWIEDAELLNLNLWEGDHFFLEWLEREGIFSAKFVYRNGELIEHHVVFYP